MYIYIWQWTIYLSFYPCDSGCLVSYCFQYPGIAIVNCHSYFRFSDLNLILWQNKIKFRERSVPLVPLDTIGFTVWCKYLLQIGNFVFFVSLRRMSRSLFPRPKADFCNRIHGSAHWPSLIFFLLTCVNNRQQIHLNCLPVNWK